MIAPYASILATLYRPSQAVKNLRPLQAQGALGLFGCFEAVDVTLSRLQEGRNKAIIKAYMAHHQGMSLVALANIFRTLPCRSDFIWIPLFRRRAYFC
ncbi:MAG: hypothetical protein IPK68_23115, partial [Bdellovibrionales bacterium]|nr:hypothetical protein [Bdellovibrionales bacterium]